MLLLALRLLSPGRSLPRGISWVPSALAHLLGFSQIILAAERSAVTASVLERGPHHRIVQWTRNAGDDSGRSRAFTNQYTEVASGLHYQDSSGQWQETIPEFISVGGGFVAARGPHQVALATNINAPGAITILTPEGGTLHSTPTLIAYMDQSTGESVRLAGLRSALGELISSNTVLYVDAFDNLDADVRATYTITGFECDVILRKQLPDPAALGLNPATTDVAIYSEWPAAVPDHTELRTAPQGRRTLTDTTLAFGSLTMDRAMAFGLDAPAVAERKEVSGHKTWEKIEGRQFLIGRTSYQELQALLRELPASRAPTPEQQRLWSRINAHTPIGLPGRSGALPVWAHAADGRLVAQKSAAAGLGPAILPSLIGRPGVMLGFSLVNTSTNFTFDSLTTYYISGPVNLGGNVTFNPGTVIKYAGTNQPSLNLLSGSVLTWLGAPYRPVTLVSEDDTAAGEPLPGASGTPRGSYANPALSLNNLGAVTLTNLCIRSAEIGILALGSTQPTVRHGQFIDCYVGLRTELNATLQNLLFDQSWSPLWTTGDAVSTGEHLTVDGSEQVHYSLGGGVLNLTNSLLADSGTTTGLGTMTRSYTAPADGPPVFASAGAGAHYLDLNHSWLQTGISTAPIAAPLGEELAAMTVQPPQALAGLITSDLVLAAYPITDRSLAAIGYHYWPVHYLASKVVLNGAKLTLTNGTVVAASGPSGFILGSGASYFSRGEPTNLNRLCWTSAIQEQGLGGDFNARRSLFDVATSTGAGAELRLSFTTVELGADTSSSRSLLQLEPAVGQISSLELTHCELAGVSLVFAPGPAGTAQNLTLFNNVWQNCSVIADRHRNGNQGVSLRHNLFLGGDLALNASGLPSHPSWTVHDNFFDGVKLNGDSSQIDSSHNGYRAGTAFWGGNGNKTAIDSTGAGGFQKGVLGGWYYPASGGPNSLAALLNSGGQSAAQAGLYHFTTQAGQIREAATLVDIGFHYVATAGRDTKALLDTDSDGLPDIVEDTNQNGVVDRGETDPNNADSDQDGALDGEEVTAGTNPLSKNSWIPKRLASWSWDGAASNWRNGDQGQLPLQTGNEFAAAGVSGNGVHLGTLGNPPLRYSVRERNGRLNLRLDQGGIRAWYKPDWVVDQAGVPNWHQPHITDYSPHLLDVGQWGQPGGFIGWYFDSQNGATPPRNGLWLKMGQVNHPIMEMLLGNTDWTQPAWHQIDLAYSSEGGTAVALNGKYVSYDLGYKGCPGECFYFGGSPVDATALPTANGFALGSDDTRPPGTGTMLAPAGGAFDNVETFNYPLGAVDNFTCQQLSIQIVNQELRFIRDFHGASPTIGSQNSLPWPLTLYRRVLGSTRWDSPLLTGSKAQTYTDTTVTPNTAYEYKAKFDIPAFTAVYRHFIAGIQMPPPHLRGNVLLLVDDTLAARLAPDVAQLKSYLVGDGWTVKHFPAPRHDDLNWDVNVTRRVTVENLIRSNYVAGVPNVIYILGHVAIPYSGTEASDGHGISNGNHRGAWVCDAYYGFLNKGLWTDIARENANSTEAVPADGKFDQNSLPGLPDFAVGRVDFAGITVFPGMNEADLIKRYLAKDFRYRDNGMPTFGRVSAYMAELEQFGANAAQGLAGAAFGIEPGRVFNGYNLVQQVPADLAIHFRYGSDDLVENGLNGAMVHASIFADPARELPVIFRQVWFSFACDWARLDAANHLFQYPNNFLRASLGGPSYGLATVGGAIWDFTPVGSGAPLGDLMTRGWADYGTIPRFESILGDPTLHLFRVTPPRNLRSSAPVGNTVALSWDPAVETGTGYYVYRSANGLDGFTTPLNSVALPSPNFTDTTASGATNTYQVRATKLQTTGSGSFWNLSQGIFITVP